MRAKNYRQAEIEERWGMPFADLIRDFAGQGLSRRQAAMAMGIDYKHFTRSLQRDGDPFPDRSVAVAYSIDTGESMRSAIERLAKTHTLHGAAKALGYRSYTGLAAYLKAHSIEVEFRPYGVRPGRPSIADLARRSGVNYNTVRQRLLAGHSDEEATSPADLRSNRRQVPLRASWMRKQA